MKKLSILFFISLILLSAGCSLQKSPSDSPRSQEQSTTVSNYIGEEKAKEIALKKAGLSPDGVIFDKAELDFNNGIWEYELEFRHDNTQYDADIKADDGTVISFESEKRD